MVFLDASFLIALIHRGDENYETAVEWMRIVEGAEVPLLTTEFCLLEVIDFLSSRGYRDLGRRLIAVLRAGALVTITPCSTALMDQGLGLHADRDDHTWSLTDCMSILVMQAHGVTDALTYDHDFEEAGMRALPLD